MKLPPLGELLAYQNEAILGYFCHKHPSYTEERAKQLFTDLMGWMWLNLHRQNNHRQTYLFGPLLALDELWHGFILHTRDYLAFCQHYFGEYFHHDVEPIGLEHELTTEELADFLNDCFEYLGTDWVNRYFSSQQAF
ncbi:hypothetical protein BN59_01209 [Legionella massiliensis]|uniref:Uncharacterized protein n=1 Tax=Legionella massiliensis TaxID=1034943 RepID=A0A078KRA9_9GAMM|nr:hypothetical protein [Legionella massiliensis]CDZ76930.1 hypothetical protein BN59_01209 [Legionella massiliensis]CEE12668.1 hypothetical protein BN1094_01209 [Legionella massiliensis]